MIKKTKLKDLFIFKNKSFIDKRGYFKEILREAEGNIEHELKEALDKVCLERMFMSVCGEIEFGDLSENQQKRLMKIVSEVVEVKSGSFVMGSPEDEVDRCKDEVQHEVELTRDYFVMKYQVTQGLWESVMGDNPSDFKGASRPVECISWLDSVGECTKDEYELRKKELEDVVNPIVSARAGGGKSGEGRKKEAYEESDDEGPTVEEVD